MGPRPPGLTAAGGHGAVCLAKHSHILLLWLPLRALQQDDLSARSVLPFLTLYFSVLQTAYNLIGTGLLPWTKSRRAFAMAYRSLLARQNIGLSSPNLTYVGSVVSGDAYS